MKYKQNLHTHTTYCDGKDTPEEIVIKAIEKGFDSVGFSGHSYMYFSPFGGMSEENTIKYKQEIRRLKEKYMGKIDIFCGLEFEMHSKVELKGYDYLIGSLHYLEKFGYPRGFDRKAEDVQKLIDTYFDGNGMKFAKEYYHTVARLPEYGDFDILGHFDLITKNIDFIKFFDIDSKEYKNAVTESVECLKGKIPFFEVNTGAIARGYRKTPYPSPFIVKEFKRMGFGAVITSDCHDKNFLDCEYETAEELLKECGFEERYILTTDGFRGVKL